MDASDTRRRRVRAEIGRHAFSHPMHHCVLRFPQLKLKQTGDAPFRHRHRYGPPRGETDAMATTNGARRKLIGTVGGWVSAVRGSPEVVGRRVVRGDLRSQLSARSGDLRRARFLKCRGGGCCVRRFGQVFSHRGTKARRVGPGGGLGVHGFDIRETRDYFFSSTGSNHDSGQRRHAVENSQASCRVIQPTNTESIAKLTWAM